MQTVGAPLASSAWICPSSLANIFVRRVDPKATSLDWISSESSVFALSKNSASLGLDPGHPASIKSMLKLARRVAILILSSHYAETDSPCVPSRLNRSSVGKLVDAWKTIQQVCWCNSLTS